MWLLRGGSRPSSNGIRRNKYHRLPPPAGAGFARLAASLMLAGRIAVAGDRVPLSVLALGNFNLLLVPRVVDERRLDRSRRRAPVNHFKQQ